MRHQRSFLSQLADRVGTLQWEFGGTRYFHLELSSRHRAYVAPVCTLLFVVSLVLAAWTAWSIFKTMVAFRELQQMEARLNDLRAQDRKLVAEAQGEGIDLSEPALKELPGEVELANQLLAKRNFSWTRFLSGLEEAIPSRVSIKSVRLDTGSLLIHLTGAAVTVEDVTALTVKLQSHPVFQDPVLGQHHTGGDGLVEFDLRVKYRPAGA